jgi:hypothetical protein
MLGKNDLHAATPCHIATFKGTLPAFPHVRADASPSALLAVVLDTVVLANARASALPATPTLFLVLANSRGGSALSAFRAYLVVLRQECGTSHLGGGGGGAEFCNSVT